MRKSRCTRSPDSAAGKRHADCRSCCRSRSHQAPSPEQGHCQPGALLLLEGAGVTQERRSSSVGDLERREPPVVGQRPRVVRSTQFGERGRSRRRGRRDDRNRGEAAVTAPRPRGAEVRPRERSALAGIQLTPAPPSRRAGPSIRPLTAPGRRLCGRSPQSATSRCAATRGSRPAFVLARAWVAGTASWPLCPTPVVLRGPISRGRSSPFCC